MDGDKIKDVSFRLRLLHFEGLRVAAHGKRQRQNEGRSEKMFDQVHEMVTTGKVNGDVGKLAVFAGVHKFPARVKCAILSWHALMAALKGEGEPVTTETEKE